MSPVCPRHGQSIASLSELVAGRAGDIGNWAVPGTYALYFHLAQPLQLVVGRMGLCELPAGDLIYVGSAFGPGGLGARLARHLRADKLLHWHIDSLTAILTPSVWRVDTSGERLECAWVRELLALSGAGVPIPGFGSSDCREGCPAHLVALGGRRDWRPLRLTSLLRCRSWSQGM